MVADKIWKMKNSDDRVVGEISEKYHLSDVLSRIIVNRGLVEDKDIDVFLNPTVDKFYDPFLMKDMDVAVERILAAKEEGQTVCIYGDYDVDGVTSTSVLYMFLEEIGCNVRYYIPDRHKEGYGVNTEALKKLKRNGVELVITVDTGITAVEQVARASELGLDVIITDHHECQEELPQALAVLNPKRPDCLYPFKVLAGCGVTFKLIHGLAKRLDCVEKIYPYLDIVAIGTVADIVPLVGENRIIVKIAFGNLFDTWCMGLKALMDVSGVKDRKITAGMIGFGIGPRLNAAGRLGDAKRGVQLLTSRDKEEALGLAKELDEENKARQEIGEKIFAEADGLVKSQEDYRKKKVLVVASEAWNHGVIGIVASRITEKYYRPSILLSVKDGIASGSARSVDGFNIFEALSSCKDLFEKFGGHEMAAGMSLKVENVEKLEKALNEYANIHMEKETLIQKYSVDMEMNLEDITIPLIESIGDLEPYGMGNPEPKFIVEGNLSSSTLIGKEKNHLKVSLKKKDKVIDGIGFGFSKYQKYLRKNDEVKVLTTLNINEWNNQRKGQLMVKDIRIDSEFYKEVDEGISLVGDISSMNASSIRVKVINDLKKLYGLPTRKDYERIYRFFVACDKRRLTSIPMSKFCEDLEIRGIDKLIISLLCIKIFEELGLIQIDISKYALEFTLIKGKKVELRESKLYNELC